VPSALLVELDTASDTGLVGDSLTAQSTVNLRGTTDPFIDVILDVDGDGSEDYRAMSDELGNFVLAGIPLVEGDNAMGEKNDRQKKTCGNI